MSDHPVTVGLAAMCANWFKEVGLQGESGELAEMLQRDYSRVVAFLEECFGRVVAPGMISTAEEAGRAVQAFQEAHVDGVLLVYLVWCEDQPLLAILEACKDIPLLLWNYHPTGKLPEKLAVNDLFRFSGTVGILEGSAPLQRLGLQIPLVWGAPGEPHLACTLRDYALAMRTWHEFRDLRAGRIAGRCEAMTGHLCG